MQTIVTRILIKCLDKCHLLYYITCLFIYLFVLFFFTIYWHLLTQAFVCQHLISYDFFFCCWAPSLSILPDLCAFVLILTYLLSTVSSNLASFFCFFKTAHLYHKPTFDGGPGYRWFLVSKSYLQKTPKAICLVYHQHNSTCQNLVDK